MIIGAASAPHADVVNWFRAFGRAEGGDKKASGSTEDG